MKKLISILTLVAILVSCVGIVSAANENEETVALVKDGKAEYNIVYSYAWLKTGGPEDAINELSAIVEQATGTPLEIHESMDPYIDNEIYIGKAPSVKGSSQQARLAAGVDFSFNDELIGENGFIIRTFGTRYLIIGGSNEATWDAIAYFVSECIGYDVNSNAEKVSTLTVPKEINYTKSEYFNSDVQVELSLGDVDISEYKVVAGAEATDSEIECANTIRRAVYALTGKEIELVRDSAEATDKEIIVGNTTRYDVSGVENGKYIIKADGSKLVIAGGDDFATEFALEQFLADYLNITNKNYHGNSVLKVAMDMNVNAELSFDKYVVEGVNYPEYIRDNVSSLLGTQDAVCYSDAATADNLYEALKAGNPAKGDEVFIISNTSKYCTCDNCKSGTAAFFNTVNKVAEKFAADGVTVSTLAYKETRAPSIEKMADNVRVYFAEPSVCCAHALNDESCESNKAAAADLVAWTKACADVYVLDFTQNYYNYPSTFPNFNILQPNISFYKEIGVNGVLMAWEKNSAALEFGELRTALISALLVNPTMTAEDYNQLFTNTMNDLYTKYAEKITEYINKFDAASAEHFTIFSDPSEILPIKKDETKTGVEAYDLTLAKELGQIWEDVYYRHEPPAEALTGLKMRIFNETYINSDYYLPLHSRVQYSSWIEANVPVADRTDVYNAIIANFTK